MQIRSNVLQLLFLSAWLATAPTSAQRPAATGDDPFGGNRSKPDPFQRGSTQSDPFAGDPFGGDPFRSPKPREVESKNGKSRVPGRVEKRETGQKKAFADNASSAEERIRTALDQMTTQSFVEVPLAEAMQQLSKSHEIPIVVDNRALEEIGLSAKDPVSLSLRQVTLRSFLRLMLRNLDLTYMIDNEVLQITTMEHAEQNLTLEIYTIPQQVGSQGDKVVEALQATVVSDTWDVIGGPSSVRAIENALIVSTTQAVHEEVQDFLDKLEAALSTSR